MILLYIACGIYAGILPIIIIKLMRIKKELEEREDYDKCLRKELTDLETAKIRAFQEIQGMSVAIRGLEDNVIWLKRTTARSDFIHDLCKESEAEDNDE